MANNKRFLIKQKVTITVEAPTMVIHKPNKEQAEEYLQHDWDSYARMLGGKVTKLELHTEDCGDCTEYSGCGLNCFEDCINN